MVWRRSVVGSCCFLESVLIPSAEEGAEWNRSLRLTAGVLHFVDAGDVALLVWQGSERVVSSSHARMILLRCGRVAWVRWCRVVVGFLLFWALFVVLLRVPAGVPSGMTIGVLLGVLFDVRIGVPFGMPFAVPFGCIGRSGFWHRRVFRTCFSDMIDKKCVRCVTLTIMTFQHSRKPLHSKKFS